MPRLRKLPKTVPKSHTIHDNGLWIIEKEYAELGIREGWLELYRIIEDRKGYHYHYKYPDNYNTE
jgi:hypothetical protein